MSKLVSVSTDRAPAAIGPYKQAMVTPQGLVFCSGQIPLDPATGKLVSGTIGEEARRAILNLQAVLEAAGSGLDKVAKVTVFLTDMADYAEVNAVYAELFGAAPPARAAVAVSGLPAGARIEIEAIGVVG